ncbi:hypothetical protein N658DRAFT_556570 [Parathielavia hyrcaniae]|uniref:Uncharacterized protein n=1 Tax=Parathielavia hyrcaniae TaxID=113614 RepID=A0AAN6T5F6_9PEZI|nr:hypothetical protein N658DRAFT_556570 [Parathielavia hyrcaniae]
MEAWEGEGSVFVVTRSYELYRELERLNGQSMCRWLSASTSGVDDDDDAKSTSTVQTDATTPDIGVLCLRAPQFSYEKSKAGLPTCFLFGRHSARRRVDVCLGRKSKTSLSRVVFALGLKNDIWAVRNMCDMDTLVNHDTLISPGTPSYALWPGRPNFIRVADIELELYCRHPYDADTFMADDRHLPIEAPSLDGTESSATSLTTTGHARPTNIPPQLPDSLYVLDDQTLPSKTPVKKILAIDAWSFTYYVLKEYPSSKAHQDILNQRLALLCPLPLARKLLRILLRLVAQLHQFGVVHNDIRLSTVYTTGIFDPTSGFDNVLLAGFSEANSNMTRATTNCLQFFQTVQGFLGQRVKLPSAGREKSTWTISGAVSLRSDIRLCPDVEEPKTITVSKGFSFRHTSQQDVSYLNAEDVKEYLSKDAAFAALEPCIRDGQVTVQDYYYFREHMRDRHADRILGLRLSMSLPAKYYIKRPISFNLTFPVPYLSRYGLVKLEYLRNLALTGFNPDVLKHLLPLCHEVRGFPEARVVYISLSHLDIIAERLGLRLEDEYDTEATDESLDEYTYQEWYLLAPHPMSKIFPVNRATNQVLTSQFPPTYTPLRTFLGDHFEAKSYLDSQVVHDLEKLFAKDPTEPLPHSCEGSVEASSHGVGFRFSSLPKPSLLLETKEKRRAETSAWVEEQGADRWNRRRAALSNRADIIPTKFGPKKAKS